MLGELAMLPVRVGLRATRLWLRVAEETATVAANATGRLIGIAASRGADGEGEEAPPRADHGRSDQRRGSDQRPDSDADEARPPQPDARARASDRAPATPPSDQRAEPASGPSVVTSAEPEPAHVSEEPVLVEEFAEPGAEDGAGAEVRIEEPWDGYRQMNAKQVIARLDTATPAELAAVQLYEGTSRRRQTILTAVQRELRSANGRSSPSP